MTRKQWYLQARARNRNRRRKKHKYRRLILFLMAVVLLFTVLSEIGLSSVTEALTKQAAEKYIIISVGNAVKNVLKSYDEDSFSSMNLDDSGNVVSVEANSTRINELKTELSLRITEELNGRKSIGIPFGSLTDIALLNGRGFDVPVKLNYIGSAELELKSEFLSAGINQSCHRITLKVRARVVSQSKRFSAEVESETEFVVAETVIVGKVPGFAVLSSARIY